MQQEVIAFLASDDKKFIIKAGASVLSILSDVESGYRQKN
jgi:hypothetical protein